MATLRGLEKIYNPPFGGAMYPEKTAAFLSEIPRVDAFGGDESLAANPKLVELRLGQVASRVRDIENGLRGLAYEASVLEIYAETHPEALAELPEKTREQIIVIKSWLSSVEVKE